MIFEMTIQVRVRNMKEGQKWYTVLFNREPDIVPHEGFAEWQIIPGCWVQIAEGIPAENSGFLRLGVVDIEAEKLRLMRELVVVDFEIQSREEVPVKWCTFYDPWGNRIGFFEYFDKVEEEKVVKRILGTSFSG
ncbi:VOC family protein [Fredinandcohnia sp. 179-A 10B2 NHS]|uniref:VOC family protein n=1 Tax=Fredinandcohnia sp. 179-A 10B2 NHS TaxID=3235176 RepID=UPI0039A32A05